MTSTTKTKHPTYLISASKAPSEEILSIIVDWLRVKTDAHYVDLRKEPGHRFGGDAMSIVYCPGSLDAATEISRTIRRHGIEVVIIRLGKELATNRRNVHFFAPPTDLEWKSKFDLFQNLGRVWRDSHVRRSAHATTDIPKLPWEK